MRHIFSAHISIAELYQDWIATKYSDHFNH